MMEPIRILYAEDDPRDADLTRARFEQGESDLQLDIVETGEQAWQRLQSEAYEALLLDNHLPDMDGLDLLKRLLAHNFTLPVVMVTGLGDEEVVVQALRFGAVDYVPKSDDYLATLPGLLRDLALTARRRQARISSPLASTRRRVLYVEHHAMDVDLTRQHLAEAAPHLTLTVVATCSQALERLVQPADFDLVLVDLRMPDMNGLDFLRELRRRGVELPCIFITGQGDEQTAIAGLKLGAADYVVKRANYLLYLPFAIERAIEHFQLDRANRALRDSEQSFRLLFSNNPHPMWVYDLETLRFLEVNAAAIDQYGYTHDEFLELTLLDIRPPDERERLLANVRQPRPALQHSGEWRHRLRDGRVIDVEITSHTLDFGGRPAVLVVAKNITERKRAEAELIKSQRLLQDITDNSAALIYALDLEGRFTLINRSLEAVFGVPRETLIGKTREAILPPDYAAAHRANDLLVQTERRALTVEETNQEPDGLHTYLSVKFPLLSADGRVQGVGGISTDITARKQAEVRLAQQLDELRRWQAVVMGRETRLLDLKHEVNQLLRQLNQPPRYPSADADATENGQS